VDLYTRNKLIFLNYILYIYIYIIYICCLIFRGCGGTGTIVSVHNTLYANVLDQIGTKEQKDKFLVGFADGTHVGCFGISEPGKWRIRNESTVWQVGWNLFYFCHNIHNSYMQQNYSLTLIMSGPRRDLSAWNVLK
jgi:hypothetical protein